MKEIQINTDSPYTVYIGAGLLNHLDGYIKRLKQRPENVMIVTDTTVGALYAEQTVNALKRSFKVQVYTVPDGESNKTPDVLFGILRALAQQKMTRSDLVLALGGGVVGDMAGFAAAVYQRGIRFIQCPTTLLSAVDASVGGKTAVDLPEGKNLIGAFHQPSLVVCDTDVFKTLPEVRFADGAAEMIKHAVISDAGLFNALSTIRWRQDIESTVARNVEIKRSFVIGDECDKGKRQILNFGHTIGHAIEAWSGFSINHGQAVAIGMVMETRAARRLGFTRMDENDLIPVIQKNGLPVETDAALNDILHFALHDKKRNDTGVTVVIPEMIGKTRLMSIDMDVFECFIEAAGR